MNIWCCNGNIPDAMIKGYLWLLQEAVEKSAADRNRDKSKMAENKKIMSF